MIPENANLKLTSRDVKSIRSVIWRRQSIAISTVVGPYDIQLIKEVRTTLDRRLFVAPTLDLLVCPLSLQRLAGCFTYCGGSKIHKGKEAWPSSGNGDPLPFIAQLDIRGRAGFPANQSGIQLFGKGPNEFAFRYIPEFEGEETGPAMYPRRLFAAPPVSVPSYPLGACVYQDMMDRVELSNGKEVINVDFFLTPLGLSFGNAPYIPGHFAAKDELRTREILATIPSLFPKSGCPFQFLGRATPLTKNEAEKMRFNVGSVDQLRHSLGILYVCRNLASNEIEVLYSIA